jgi:hypothetical protein
VPPKLRISFLPLFLTLLTLGFGVALAMRVRSYSSRPALPAATTAVAAPEAAAGATTMPATHPSTGTIVEAPATATHASASRASSTGERPLTRAERFRQLLALPPPSSQPATVVATPPPPRPQPSPPPPRPRPVVPQHTPPAPVRNSGGGGPVTPTPHASQSPSGRQQPGADPNDPTSDSIPPQLLAVEFNPPQVRDGEDSTLIITATDNLSGVRGISGTLTSPSGKALQGFAQQRELPESNRYISKITMPKDAEEGIWRVNFINMTDNASNSVTLSYAQGGVPQNAVLKVTSSRSDNTPPTLRNIYLQKRAMHTGEHNLIHIQADDDKSGVRLVAAVFVSPQKFARLGVGCQKGDNELWTCDFMPPECLDCGEWQLEQVQLQDNANNLATVRSENPLVAQTRINITGDSCDSQPPVLQALVLDRNVVAAGAEVTVTVTVSDDLCGVSGVSGQFTGPGQGSGRFFPFTQSGDPNTWVGRIKLEPQSPKGIWRISTLTVNDKGQNTRVYFANEPLLQNGQFQLR